MPKSKEQPKLCTKCNTMKNISTGELCARCKEQKEMSLEEAKEIAYEVTGDGHVVFKVNGNVVRTGAYQDIIEGIICFVICPSCRRENYAMSVSEGLCA